MKISKNESKEYEDIYEDEYENEEMVESEVHAIPPRSPAPEPPKKEKLVKD